MLTPHINELARLMRIREAKLARGQVDLSRCKRKNIL